MRGLARLSVLAAALLAALAAALAVAPQAQALDGPERALIGAINEIRTERGLRPLRYEPRLGRIAEGYAAASARGAGRDDPALDVAGRLSESAYAFLAMRAFVEGGDLDPTAQARAWAAERSRRDALLDPAFVEIGAGHVSPPRAPPDQPQPPPNVWSIVLAAPTGPAAADWGERILSHVNDFRAENGLIPLSRNRLLDQAAQAHAEDMARRDFFAHTTPEGTGPAARVDRTGYHWSVVLENLAAGQPTPREVVDGWIRSKTGHREAMLSKEVRELGVGYRYLPRDGGRLTVHHYWAMTLAAPR